MKTYLLMNKEENNNEWNRILNSGKILSDEEADEMQKIVEKMRKEKGFRNIANN